MVESEVVLKLMWNIFNDISQYKGVDGEIEEKRVELVKKYIICYRIAILEQIYYRHEDYVKWVKELREGRINNSILERLSTKREETELETRNSITRWISNANFIDEVSMTVLKEMLEKEEEKHKIELIRTKDVKDASHFVLSMLEVYFTDIFCEDKLFNIKYVVDEIRLLLDRERLLNGGNTIEPIPGDLDRKDKLEDGTVLVSRRERLLNTIDKLEIIEFFELLNDCKDYTAYILATQD